MCCGFWGIWTLSITEGLGDLIALEWSLTRNRVSGRWRTVGQEEAQSKWEKLPSLLYWAHLRGIPRLVQKRQSAPKDFYTGFFGLGDVFAFSYLN